MTKHDSAFFVVIISFILLLFAGALRDESTAKAGPHPVPKPWGGPGSEEQAEQGDSLTLTYIANMGVYINSSDRRVMIDCLFGRLRKSRFPAPETLDSMMNGIPPYDDIDLVLVTHRDRDHFDSAMVIQYMLARREPILVVPADAAEKMRAVGSDWSEIESRVMVVDLEIGETLKTELAGIPITVFRSTHGTSTRPMNLMYQVEVNDWRVFHEGDASGKADDYLAFGLDTMHFDLAIMQHGWPMHPHQPYRLFFQNDFRADHIALGHVALSREGTAESELDNVRKYYDDIFVLLPGMPEKVFTK